MTTIREERPEDFDAVRHVNRLAFGQDAEGRLVDLLRESGGVVVSMVAVDDATREVVGHILFSRLQIETAAGYVSAVSLAPMAVAPAWQRRGVGSRLVRRGLDQCLARGEKIVSVLGHAAYYPRFGFSPELAKPLDGPYAGVEWMALELVPGALAGVAGKVRYPEAFRVVGA
jgi:putative acetyltransferase